MSLSKKKRAGGEARRREIERRKAMKGGALEGNLLGKLPKPEPWKYRKTTAKSRKRRPVGLFVKSTRYKGPISPDFTL